MSMRLEMLQVARLAPRVLGDSAQLVESFVRGQWNGDGGVKDRSDASDLYYTVFGLESLAALQQTASAPVKAYLASFADAEGQDLVHRCCLARAWSVIGMADFPHRQALAAAIAAQRAGDGGFAAKRGEACGSAYAAYLALGALQDLGAPLPPAGEVLPAIASLRTADGGYANAPGGSAGTTPATVSAVMVHHVYAQRADQVVVQWLRARQRLPEGGFLSHAQAPMPDLLSTATALHALACLECALPPEQAEAALDYIDSLWTNVGSFHGHWAEDILDVEYTYYGLLALGHLSL
jgi:prenyltransferase beta subunit